MTHLNYLSFMLKGICWSAAWSLKCQFQQRAEKASTLARSQNLVKLVCPCKPLHLFASCCENDRDSTPKVQPWQVKKAPKMFKETKAYDPPCTTGSVPSLPPFISQTLDTYECEMPLISTRNLISTHKTIKTEVKGGPANGLEQKTAVHYFPKGRARERVPQIREIAIISAPQLTIMWRGQFQCCNSKFCFLLYVKYLVLCSWSI